MFKKLLIGIMTIVLCVVGLSGCETEENFSEIETMTETITQKTTALSEKTQTTKPTETTAIETTTAEYELTEEDLQLLDSMPEIVFITSHYYFDENIKGYFITNEGEIKMYDFRNIAPDETYDLLEVMDRLDTAVCTEIDEFKAEDLCDISKIDLIKYYKLLLDIKSNETIPCESYLDVVSGFGCFYGIRNNGEDEEIITLNGWGNCYYENTDINASLIDCFDLFPGLL